MDVGAGPADRLRAREELVVNVLKKTYCRVFQTAFRVALPVLPYREPKPLGSVAEVGGVLKGHGSSKALIVTDPTVEGLGLIEGIKRSLVDAGLSYSVFAGVVANPTIACVEAARAQYVEEDCDALIAVGGGSSMDCAKVCGARVVRPDEPISKMRGILKVHHRLPPFIAVPTTAGTGSETTLAAVITDGETHYKYPINDFCLIPHYAVLDWRMTEKLPASVTATTGMDALVHAVEAYIGRSTTRQTRSCAELAVRLIEKYLLRAYENGEDAAARKGMLRAAYSAGLAFTKSYVGYVHGVAHSLGGQYGTPHGLANAVLLTYFLDEYGESCEHRLAKLARNSGVVERGLSDAETSRAFIAWVRKMNRALGIPEKIEGIREEDIPVMAAHADRESNPLYPVPKLMDAKELERMYRKVMAA